MHISLNIPDDIAAHLRITSSATLERATVEYLALAGYLTGTLSRFHVQRLLGFDNRWDAEEWLGSQGAVMRFSHDALERDRATLDRLLGPAATTTEPAPLSGNAWIEAFDAMTQRIESRSNRYPPGFRADDSREAIYFGRDE